VGRCADPRTFDRGGDPCLEPWRIELVRSREFRREGRCIDFLNAEYAKDIDFYQKILTDRGAVGSLMAARGGAAYSLADPFFGGEMVWQNFADWLSKVPPVNYGIFTNEVDAAVTRADSGDRQGRADRRRAQGHRSAGEDPDTIGFSRDNGWGGLRTALFCRVFFSP